MTSIFQSIPTPPLDGSSGDRGRQALDELVETVVAVLQPGLHAGLDHRVARLDSLEHRVAVDAGHPVAEVLEPDRVQADVPRRSLLFEGLDQAVDGLRPMEHAMERVAVAVAV